MLENLRVDAESRDGRGKPIKLKRLSTGPIMLTCYTNHALDQFLEHISVYTQEIVRLGGRPKEEMKQFSIMEVSKRKGFNLGRKFFEYKTEREMYENQYNRLTREFRALASMPVFSKRFLEEY